MSLIKKNLLYVLWVVIGGLLALVSFQSYNSTTSILAQVEPQKHAISYHKAVRVKEIFVLPGQEVKKGDPLLKVERQDLLLEVDNMKNNLERLQSQISIYQIEKQHEMDLAQMDVDLITSDNQAEIERLKLLLQQQAEIAQSIESLNISPSGNTSTDRSYVQLRIEVLREEISHAKQQYQLKKKKLNTLYELKIKESENEMKQYDDQLVLLQQEESELYQVAKEDGTVGNILIEQDELASPFTTLMTIYAHDPSVIRALINERQNAELNTGQSVIVESTNRAYHVSGTISEIGSRIIEYPSRLKINQELPMYGREIFIKIPDQSNFLHGEKVYVKLK
ncbi:hypothetical protein BFP72_18055 [Reichenbachiella sp. 5M10]|uniref:Multidrug resistance efflux pump n=1 Tax=Reichenbachiella agariperforans TaxID=156994 RepID=A0A1M6NTF7_REIAG|nr:MULTISPECIES: HlyD family efflux transporter periplasmic adaptor subunit [Reichenbachiella]PIB37174.1 hypothetical protein BFP72_18055 [Reichenbachiella sp. 5M10]SHJ98940.1 Multidrug resistance efflux pump [Reichenbachiella agariperforans]